MAGPASKLEVGQVIEDRYVLERVVGQGGMGIVFAARHLELREMVAIKMLQSASMQDPHHVDRFLREARLASRIKSEHVVRVLDVARGRGEVPPYIVMEYLEGSDLGDMLARNGALPTIQAVDYVLQACEAVAEAHRLGIVHRDLKPSNLLVTQRADGTPLLKVLDFGISKTDDREESSSITTTSAVFGSPAYMSPEQIRSAKNVDARSDVWALAVVLFEFLTGRIPFDGENAAAVLAAVSADAPLSLTRLVPSAPIALEKVIEACLVKDRSQRVPSVVQMAELLSPFASAAGRVSVASVRAIGSIPTSRPSAAPPSSEARAARTSQGMTTTVAAEAKFHTDQALVVNSQTGRGLRAPAVAALVGAAGGLLVLVATWTTMNLGHRAPARVEPSALASPIVSAADPAPAPPTATATATAPATRAASPELPDPPPTAIARPAPAPSSRPGRPRAPAAPASARPRPSPVPAPTSSSGTTHVPDTDSRQ